MRYQLIEFFQIKQTKKFTSVRDCVFKPAGRFQWLQRLAWLALVKLSDSRRIDFIHERIVIDRDKLLSDGKLLDAISSQITEIYRQYNVRGARLLIGAEDFHRLQSMPECRQKISFGIEFSMRDGRHDFIFGLSVQVIPWMRGMLVMPPEGKY